MKTLRLIVNNPIGIHARPAALLAQACVGFKSSVLIRCNNKEAAGNNVLQILSLNAKKGDSLVFEIEGDDEELACRQIMALMCDDVVEENVSTPLKIAFFGTKDYDKTFFTPLEKDKGPGTYNCDITYLESRLTKETASLARGYDAVCIFVNDDASKEVVDILAGSGIRLILLRCAGFNNVDLEAAKEHGIKVARVPAYSP
ncbi:MAG: HPr family phosphocarrier protein, partial [Erysipelotrichaceae bacterium]|nr:HPr family phosphocarrier protein [Erysipelotrichaceae bacterium]